MTPRLRSTILLLLVIRPVLGCIFSTAHGAPGDILWTYDTGDPVFASPTVGRDGTIYIGSNAATCTALVFSAGGEPMPKWVYQADDWIDATAALGEDGTVYVGTYNSTLAALSPSDGQPQWEITLGEAEGLPGIVQSSPAIASDGLIVVATSAGAIHGIRPSGEEAWFHEFGADTRSSPAIDTACRIYFGADDGQVRCLSAAGELLWTFPVDGAGDAGSRIYGSPALDGEGNIYIGAGNGFLYSLDSEGELRWKFETPEAVDTNPAIDAENNVYFASRNGSLYCVSSAGDELWSVFLGDIFFSSPIIDADGFVYITYFAGGGISYVIGFAPGGQEVWQTPIESVIDSSLALTVDGHLLVGAFDGRLLAIEGSAPMDYTVPWARFRRDTRSRGRVIEGSLPHVGTAMRPLALRPGATAALELAGAGQDGELFAWRQDGVALTLDDMSRFVIGPMSVEQIGVYDVIASNTLGEVLSPSTVVTQLNEPEWEITESGWRAVFRVTHPADPRFALQLSSDLRTWDESTASPLPVSDVPGGRLESTEAALDSSDRKAGFVRARWEP